MNLKDMNKDDLLRALGLETRKSGASYILPAIGIFGAALIIGAGIGMMLAPKSGRELRGDLNERFSGIKTRVKREAEHGVGQGPVTSTTPY